MDQTRLVKALDTFARYAHDARWDFIQAEGMAYEEDDYDQAVSFAAQAHAIAPVVDHAAAEADARRPEDMPERKEPNQHEAEMRPLKPKAKAARDARDNARLAGKAAIDAVIEAHAAGEPELAAELLTSITALFAVPAAEHVQTARAQAQRVREYRAQKESKSA